MDKFLTIKQNEIKLAKLRGYDVSNAEAMFNNITVPEFERMIGYDNPEVNFHENLSSVYTHLTDPTDILIVFYISTPPTQSISSETIRDILFHMNKMIRERPGINFSVILISEAEPTTHSKGLIEKYNGASIQIMMDNEIGFDLMAHKLVPEQVILSKERGDEVLRNYGVTNRFSIPLAGSDDPVVRLLGGKRGDLLQSIRTLNYTIVSKQPNVRCIT